MKIGDLVCYNAAGQKYKTLGIVYEFGKNGYHHQRETVLIQWCMVGDLMPFKEWNSAGYSRDPIKPSEFAWHQVGDWFEVVNENR